MGYALVAFLTVNIALATGVAGSILYASAVPYPYYALTYSYTRPTVVPSYPLGLNFEAVLPPPVIAAATGTTSLEYIAAIVNDRQLEEVMPCNQSPPEAPPSSTALGEAAPSIASETESRDATATATESESPYPGAAALGEPTSVVNSSSASDEQEYPSLPVTYTILTPIGTQFYRQDESNYGEHGLKDGTARGDYSYTDAEGKLQIVSHISTDDEGFRIVPAEIPDSPEVTADKAAHLQAKAEPVAKVNKAIAVDSVAAATPASACSGKDDGEGCK